MQILMTNQDGTFVPECPDCVCQHGIWLKPCHGGTMCDTPIGYLTGKFLPNYPVPATQDNAERSLNWLTLSICPHKPNPCFACIDKFNDAIECDYL